MDRLDPETVVTGCRTTSDKIRALARAGYSRSEIAAILRIRYQHARKVMLDAGITGGLTRDASFERTEIVLPEEATRFQN